MNLVIGIKERDALQNDFERAELLFCVTLYACKRCALAGSLRDWCTISESQQFRHPRIPLNVSMQPISPPMSLVLSADGREREIRVNIDAIRGYREGSPVA